MRLIGKKLIERAQQKAAIVQDDISLLKSFLELFFEQNQICRSLQNMPGCNSYFHMFKLSDQLWKSLQPFTQFALDYVRIYFQTIRRGGNREGIRENTLIYLSERQLDYSFFLCQAFEYDALCYLATFEDPSSLLVVAQDKWFENYVDNCFIDTSIWS